MQDSAPVRLERQSRQPWMRTTLIGAGVVVLVYLLILSVGMVGSGFKTAAGGEAAARNLFKGVGDNPLLGLVIGILATSLVQSSSTVTSVIVALVCGGMSVKAAVPMVMGANIGTTVTNTLVSMAHITRPQEFRRAFAAATVHDFFNFLAVAIFLTLEVLTRWLFGIGFLEAVTRPIAAFFIDAESGKGMVDANLQGWDFIQPVTKPLIHFFYHGHKDGTASGLFGGFGFRWGGIALVGVGIVCIFTSIFALGKILKANLTGRAERLFHLAVGRGPLTGIASGTIITMLVQSSSTTTSLIVPMAGTGVLRLKQVFPFTLGANIGTTITALLASLAGNKDPLLARAMLQIALVHTCFNVFGTILIYGVPMLRRIPLRLAIWLAKIATRNRILAVLYVVCAFYLVPLLLMGIVSGIRSLTAPAPVPMVPKVEQVEEGDPTDSTPSPEIGENAKPSE